MAGVTKGTGVRFCVWVGIGQIVYFAYGFWHSKKRKPKLDESVAGEARLDSTTESVMMENSQYGSEPNLAKEIIESRL
jgi:hypothetical protein